MTGGCGSCSKFIVLRNASAVTCASSTLDFVLRGLAGPIVLANDRLPVNRLHASNGRGLVATVRVTSTGSRGNEPVIPRMYVFFGNGLVENGHTVGVGTRKFRTFRSFGCPRLYSINVGFRCRGRRVLAPSCSGPVVPRLELSPGIVIFDLFPNVRSGVIHRIVRSPSLQNVIVHAFNSKGTPRSP